jgi:hypothetical protein
LRYKGNSYLEKSLYSEYENYRKDKNPHKVILQGNIINEGGFIYLFVNLFLKLNLYYKMSHFVLKHGKSPSARVTNVMPFSGE